MKSVKVKSNDSRSMTIISLLQHSIFSPPTLSKYFLANQLDFKFLFKSNPRKFEHLNSLRVCVLFNSKKKKADPSNCQKA